MPGDRQIVRAETPLAASTALVDSPDSNTEVTSSRPLTILVAEDNVVNQRVAQGILDKRGHTVIIANNGREAVQAVATQRFDLVLMDLQMPEMGGLEATATIRQMETVTGGHTPIVAMTAHAMTGDQERCLAAGMDAYLSKPIRPQQLLATINRLVGVDAERRFGSDRVQPILRRRESIGSRAACPTGQRRRRSTPPIASSRLTSRRC